MDRARLNETLAPLLIGGCFSAMSTGLVIALAGTYWSKCPSDRLWLKLCVLASVVWALVDTGFNLSWVYNWTVQGFLNPTILLEMPRELIAFCVTMPGAVLVVQAFFLWRCWIVSGRRSYILVVVLAAMCLGCFGIATYLAAYCARHDWIDDFQKLHDISWVWFAGILVTDVGITGSMLYYLVVRPRPHLRNVDSSHHPHRLFRIVERAIQTNALAIVCQICIVPLYARYPTSLYFTLFGMCEAKVYIGSFIATLNARTPTHNGAFDSTLDDIDGRLKQSGLAGAQPVTVTVRQELRVDEDAADSVKDAASSAGMKAGFGASAAPFRVQFHQDDQYNVGEKGDVELQRLG
ncbi:hypothetical protein JCM10212_002748 [Sporobolomyces blumeae]